MAPRLRVLAGTSAESMVPITPIVNTGRTHRIASDVFEGEVVAYIQGFTDENGKVRDSEYFQRKDRQGITWSIQVQGRFLANYSADDILFGNTFDRPLKLPWGTSAVLKFMHFIDPTLEHELDSKTKPWALSPLISTMPYFMHTRIPMAPILLSPADALRSRDSYSHANSGVRRQPQPRLNLSLPEFPPSHSIEDDTSQLYLTSTVLSSPCSDSGASSPGSDASSVDSTGSRRSSRSSGSQSSTKSGSLKNVVRKMGRRKQRGNDDLQFENASQRRAYFSDAKNRQEVEFGPMDVITTDFCYGFINFSPSLSLQLPGGLSFDLVKYWDGQPVRFVCCERKDPESSTDGDPWGRIFWCVSIEMVDDEKDEDVD